MTSPKVDDVRGLYEQLKRVVRGTWEFGDGFLLACSVCGQAYDDTTTMGVVSMHFEEQHPDVEPQLDLVWIGEGMPPEPQA